jgi:hypothetical protein
MEAAFSERLLRRVAAGLRQLIRIVYVMAPAGVLVMIVWGRAPVMGQEYIRDVEPIPDSVDRVIAPMDEAFKETPTPPGVFPLLREKLKRATPFLRDTRLDLNVRSYYKYEDDQVGKSEAWALGGSLSYRSGWFLDHFAVGSVLYTSQPAYAPETRDGTGLLKSGQKGYTVLGQIYGRVKLVEDNFLNLYRYEYNTPFINRNESRMTPNTFEGYTLTGAFGGKGGAPGLNYGFGYIDKIKTKTSTDFISMSREAGAQVKRGVFAGGGRVSYDGVTAGAIDYYSKDIINIFYTEGNYRLFLTDRLGLLFSVQFTDQRSTGDDLLKGDSFSTHMAGAKADLSYRHGIVTLAYTRNADTADLQNPWSGYPGYTSVQVESFKRAGENAFMVKFSYDFARLGLEGVAAYALFTHGWGAVNPSTGTSVPDKNEFDADMQWRPQWKFLQGLWFRVRYANAHEYEGTKNTSNDFRVIVNYDIPLL